MVRGHLILALALAAAPAAMAADALDVALGKALFDRSWVSAPASTKSDDGLGPLFDARSCVACHIADSPYHASEAEIPTGMVIRLGNGQGAGDPVYGHQLQTRAVPGVEAEAAPAIAWSPDGNLRRAKVSLPRLGYGPLDTATRVALRRPPALDGIGLLARVPDGEILERERGGTDGVTGRAAWLVTEDGTRRLGRFGWKATEPDLTAQTATALSRDMGMSTGGHSDAWGECSPAQRACRAAPHGAEKGAVEISDRMRDLIVAFLDSKQPPPQKKLFSPVYEGGAEPVRGGGGSRTNGLSGVELFETTSCAACHATLHLADGTPVRAYTDLLLHDMGDGLADGIAEGAATGREWRTAPLWGVAAALRRGGLLHDARARNVREAIAWHGGEAAGARARFDALSDADKKALLDFVSGL